MIDISAENGFDDGFDAAFEAAFDEPGRSATQRRLE